MGVFFNDIEYEEKCWYRNLFIQMTEIMDDPDFITEDEDLKTFSCYAELHSHPVGNDGKNHIIIPTPLKFLPVESFEKSRKSLEGVPESAGDGAGPVVLRKSAKRSGCKSLSIMSREQSLAFELKEKGTQAFKKENYEEAIKLFTQGIENYPDYNPLLTNRASCLNMMERYEEAIADCDEALMIEPNCCNCSSRTYIQKGKAYMGLGQFDEARKCYQMLKEVGQVVMADICLKKVNEISVWFDFSKLY